MSNETGALTGAVMMTADEARRSVDVARETGTRFFDEIVRQVEGKAWDSLGYADWDAMREGEYADMGVTVPRADRPELVTRLRRTGMTQQEVADTLGVTQRTVSGDLNSNISNEDPPASVTNARGQQRPATYRPREPAPTPAHDPFLPPARGPAQGRPPEGSLTEEAKKARAAEKEAADDRAAMTDLYSGIARGLQTCGVYGAYEDIETLMERYSVDYLDPPQYEREFEEENLRSVVRFGTALLKWKAKQ